MATTPGPRALWLVRHAESQGNLADARAADVGAQRLELDVRDPDVPLSATGRGQAEALGAWLRDLPAERRPTALLSSPFTRAADTATVAIQASGLDLPIRFDERLRERDFGAFDGMTSAATCSASSTTGRRAGRAGPTWRCGSAASWPRRSSVIPANG
jgi:broad specificity phosphatase PhoE